MYSVLVTSVGTIPFSFLSKQELINKLIFFFLPEEGLAGLKAALLFSLSPLQMSVTSTHHFVFLIWSNSTLSN